MADDYYHPSSEEEIVNLVRKARAEKKQLRVRGSMHSFPPALIQTDHPPGQSPGEINVMLDRYRKIEWLDRDKGIVRVQAGCNLGVETYDPTKSSTWENSLLRELHEAGWALDTLGGVTHQTVSGFISTGSSGGTLHYHISENIIALRFIDGTGAVHEVSPQSDPNLFNAAGVSMGLLGVLSTVTFQCVKAYAVEGNEATTTYDNCAIDLFGSGTDTRPSLAQWLRDTPEGRIMWWPQENVERVVVWQAKRIPLTSGFQPNPYEELSRCRQRIVSLLLTLLGRHTKTEIATRGRMRRAVALWSIDKIFAMLVGLFVQLDGPEGPKPFRDYWWRGLPMDNDIDDKIMPVWFAELWVPVEKTPELMAVLREYFKGGLDATGMFSFEIYGSKANPFWMSPSHNQDVFRLDCLWFAKNAGDPRKLFRQYWDLLRPFGFRPHWGKFLPDDSDWPAYFARQFPRWNDFLALRGKLDPDGIFLTRYWRSHLGIG